MTTIWKKPETKRQTTQRKLDIDHQRGQYYEHCSRSIVPRELKEKQRCLSFSQQDEEIYSSRGERRTNSSNMEEPIKTRQG